MPEVFDVGGAISKLHYYKHSRHSIEQIGVRSTNPENLQALVPKKINSNGVKLMYDPY
jgi:hypothetical protein